MNRNISSVLVGLCLISTMQSVFATPARTQSVKELIKLSEFENILSTSLDEMQPTLDSEAENIENQHQCFSVYESFEPAKPE